MVLVVSNSLEEIPRSHASPAVWYMRLSDHTYLNLLSLNTYSYITFEKILLSFLFLLIERLQNRLGSGMWDRRTRSPRTAL